MGSSRPGWRLVGNVAMLGLTGAVVWLVLGNVSIGDRVTRLETTDCKAARLTNDGEAAQRCIEQLDFNDRFRSVESACIQQNRTNYPCPLTDSQRKKLESLLNGGKPNER